MDNTTEAAAPAAFRSATATWLRRSAAAAGKEERPEAFDEIILRCSPVNRYCVKLQKAGFHGSAKRSEEKVLTINTQLPLAMHSFFCLCLARLQQENNHDHLPLLFDNS